LNSFEYVLRVVIIYLQLRLLCLNWGGRIYSTTSLLSYQESQIAATKQLIIIAKELADKEMVTFYLKRLMARSNELTESDTEFLISETNSSQAIDIENLFRPKNNDKRIS
jgi:hypothetical protein